MSRLTKGTNGTDSNEVVEENGGVGGVAVQCKDNGVTSKLK